jgi:hypothetical protein
MPFMPEMLQFAGGTFTVYKRADKTCDTTHSTGLRRIHDTVHLAELRCDGSAHGGCQAGCLLYWNERWLRRSGTESKAPAAPALGVESPVPVTETDLQRLTRAPDGPAGTRRYTCQATEVFASSTPLPWWDPTQYLRDITTRNATIRQVLVGIARWLSVRIQWRINRSGVPFVKGRLQTTPKEVLNLQPGERVRIKSRREIVATLDTENRNRGLRVDPDQMLFCGREFRVLRRINRIIDERTREMIEIRGDCLVLDGTTCTGTYNRSCPRSDNPYWREIWLERVEAPPAPSSSATRTVRNSSDPA